MTMTKSTPNEHQQRRSAGEDNADTSLRGR
jgi:hypothetical protein